MVRDTLGKTSKNRSRSETLAILSCPEPKGHRSGTIERGLRKTRGIKDVTMNPLMHTIKILYDPNTVTVKEIRSILKKLHSDSRTRNVRTKHRQP
jgi:copper chaperone CopZ